MSLHKLVVLYKIGMKPYWPKFLILQFGHWRKYWDSRVSINLFTEKVVLYAKMYDDKWVSDIHVDMLNFWRLELQAGK